MAEIKNVLKVIKNNKYPDSDRIIGELLKYGGQFMREMLLTLFNLTWSNEFVPRYWREGLIVSLFKREIGKTLVIIGVLLY